MLDPSSVIGYLYYLCQTIINDEVNLVEVIELFFSTFVEGSPAHPLCVTPHIEVSLTQPFLHAPHHYLSLSFLCEGQKESYPKRRIEGKQSPAMADQSVVG